MVSPDTQQQTSNGRGKHGGDGSEPNHSISDVEWEPELDGDGDYENPWTATQLVVY
jgi:hypothetical protein